MAGSKKTGAGRRSGQVEAAANFSIVDVGASSGGREASAQEDSVNEELQKSDDRFRILFASAPMAVFVCDINAIIQDYNIRAAQLWGREPKCGYEKHCGSTKLWLPDGTHLPHDQSPIVEVLRTGVPVHNVEVIIERPDGSRLPVLVDFAALKGEKDEVTGAITSFIDITDRKQAEWALRVSEERYRDLFNSMDEGYCIIRVIFDGNGAPVDYLFEEVNPAFERQTGMHDVVGKRMLEFVPDIEAHWLENFGNVAMTGEPVRFANEYKGLERWFEVFAFRVGEPEERRVALLFNDITERRRSEMANLQKQKFESMGVLAGGIAHDFNNLLTVILGAGNLVAEMPELPDEARPLVDGIVTASHRAADLTRQILAYAGKGRFIIGSVDLSDQVTEVIKLLSATVPKTVRFDLDLQANLPAVTADRGQLQQVIMNLVLNAAESSPEGLDSAVSIWTKRRNLSKKEADDDSFIVKAAPGEFIALTVKDRGSGMDAATLLQIFDPFYSTKAVGRGLGLSAVLGIVRGHHGCLRIESSPGEGSTFTVLFPVAEAAIEQVSEDVPIAEEAAPKQQTADTILVIDDEAVILQVISAALKPTGVNVLTAANGLEGVEAFQRSVGHVSTVLLDLMMPVMEGHEALKRIRAINPNIRVVAMSGYTERDAIHHFGNDDQITFLQKPFTTTELLRKLDVPTRRDR